MTWKRAAPQSDTDQYMLWIHRKTHLMDRFDCAGRRVLPWIPSPFIAARVEYKGYRKIQGFQVPTTIRVYRAKTQGLVHGYAIRKARFSLTPRPTAHR